MMVFTVPTETIRSALTTVTLVNTNRINCTMTKRNISFSGDWTYYDELE